MYVCMYVHMTHKLLRQKKQFVEVFGVYITWWEGVEGVDAGMSSLSLLPLPLRQGM